MPTIYPLSYRLDHMPAASLSPLVLDSPHSGTAYPPDFASIAHIGVLRTAEDTWVDDLWSGAVNQGVPLLGATCPRAYIDVNRGVEDIDSTMLDAPWPGPLSNSPKVGLGKGLIWRMLDDGTPLYDRKLSVAEVQARIDQCWRPYHDALRALLDDTHAQLGKVWHINCHSMPSVAGAYATGKPGTAHPDFVLGDRDGTTADPAFAAFVADWLGRRGYDVAINDPYKGVELVRVHGRPSEGRHSLQIEINRKLYMDEVTLRPNAGYDGLKNELGELTSAMLAWMRAQVAGA